MSIVPNLDEMTDEQKLAVLESVQKSIAESKEIQKRKIGENVELVVQALKKIESDIRDRFDAVGNTIEKRVSSIKDGRDGANGKDGRDGKDGRPGKDGLKGDRGADGQAGRDGVDGVDGISVVNANIDFDGSLIISLSDGREINVGEVVSQDVAEKIKVISTMSTNAAIAVKEEGTTITNGVKSLNFVGAGVTATTSGDDVTVTVAGGGGSGTVTSVALSGGTTGLTVTGSPITTTGTITLAGILAAANGGTGQSSYAVGDLLYASTTTALSKLADVATGNTLISGGVGVAPSWGKVGLTTHVSGTLPTANGGTNLTSFTANGVVYASSTSALATGSALVFNGTNLGVGITSPVANVDIHPASSGITKLFLTGYGAASAPNVQVRRANGTQASPTAATTGNFLGGYHFGGYGATVFSPSASGDGAGMQGIATEPWTDTAQGASVRFLVTTIGATAAAEVMRLTSTGIKTKTTISVGDATPSTSGAGITFPATDSASSDANTLDDYEEGTWLPVLGGVGGTSGQTYTGQAGRYTKIGRQVTCWFYVELTAKGTITGDAAITGLPFTVNTGAGDVTGMPGRFANFATNWTLIFAGPVNGQTYAWIGGTKGVAGTWTQAATADIANNTRLEGCFTYNA